MEAILENDKICQGPTPTYVTSFDKLGEQIWSFSTLN